MNSPCESCIYNVCIRHTPETRWEPEENYCECSKDMRSYGTDEGCYKYEENMEE